jgi:hypothetical protein
VKANLVDGSAEASHPDVGELLELNVEGELASALVNELESLEDGGAIFVFLLVSGGSQYFLKLDCEI